MEKKTETCPFCGRDGRKGNYKLADNPCPLLDDAPCQPCQEMEVLEAQIADAESVLSSLLKRHQEVRRAMNTNHDRLLKKVPSEILSHIFKFAVEAWFHDCLRTQSVPDPFADRIYSAGKSLPIPLVLGSICQQWRRIAWRSPELWTFLMVEVGNVKSQERYLLIIEWLLRSGSLPLTIHVFGDSHLPLDEAMVFNVIYLINQCSERWRNLILSVPSVLVPLFDGRAGNPQPTVLSNLYLEIVGNRRDISEGNFQVINTIIPSPRVVGIAGFLAHNAHIHWSNIHTLSLCRVFFQNCMQTLRQIPRLEDLSLQWMSDSGEQLSSEELSIPTLVTLSFYCQNAYKINGKHLLHYFHLPNLKKFLFDGSKQYFSSLCEVHSFLSSCSPEELKIAIKTHSTPKLSVAETLLRHPSIRYLEVNSAHHDMLDIFSHGYPSSLFSWWNEPLLPNLEYLKIKHISVFYLGYRWSIILEVLNGPQRQSLRYLELIFVYNDVHDRQTFQIDKDVINQILLCRTAGKTVKIFLECKNAKYDLLEDAIRNMMRAEGQVSL